MKLFLTVFFYISFSLSALLSSEYNEVIEKYFSNRKLDTIEGIWKKTFANQGSTGCITIFFKAKNDLFNQMHIDSCFVMNKVTGKQKKTNQYTYSGENAVYYYNGDVKWGGSKISIAEDFNSFSILHMSANNTFKEEWERVWPINFKTYNDSFVQLTNK